MSTLLLEMGGELEELVRAKLGALDDASAVLPDVEAAASERVVFGTTCPVVIRANLPRVANAHTVYAIGSATPPRAAALFRMGVADVLGVDHLHELREADRRAVAERFTRWAERETLSGTLVAKPNTPLEGQARFSRGEFKQARFCGLEGPSALAAMLRLEALGFTELDQAPYQPTVLVADDNATLRLMLARVLELAGFKVLSAPNGADALTCARTTPLDLVVTDLDMPELDGWGLLRELRADARLSEVAVVMLSSHEQALQALQAASAGAQAYLNKAERADELVAVVRHLTTERIATAAAVRSHANLTFDASLGLRWLVERLADAGATALLAMEDAVARYELQLEHGHLAHATAQVGSLRFIGDAALASLLASTGSGTVLFRNKPTPAPLFPLRAAPGGVRAKTSW